MKKEMALVPAVAKVVSPKPTKSEIIEALALLQFKQAQEAREDMLKKKHELEQIANEKLLKYVRSVSKNCFMNPCLGHIWSRERTLEGVNVRIDCDSLPQDVEKAIRAYHNCVIPSNPSLSDIRRKIRDAVNDTITNKTERVNRLLESPESRKALETTLKTLGFKTQLTLEV